MKYEPTSEMSRAEVRRHLMGTDDNNFARALRSAAMFFSGEEFEQSLVVASGHATNAGRMREIAEAISTIVQARRIVPTNASDILSLLPDGEETTTSRDEALSLVRRTQETPDDRA